MPESRKPTETPSPRMQPLARLPVFYGLNGRRVVVAGTGAPAAWKIELLSAAGARVDVFAASPAPEIRDVVADPPDGPVTLHERAWQPADLAGAAIAVGEFGEEADAARFAAAARAAGVPVNVVDKPAHSDFAFGAIV